MPPVSPWRFIGPWFVYFGKDARKIPAVIRGSLCGQRPGYGVLAEATLVAEMIDVTVDGFGGDDEGFGDLFVEG